MFRRCQIVAIGLAILALGLVDTSSFAEDKPIVIKPEEAREYEGKLVSVTFKVKAAKDAKHRKTVFLDSEEDFQNEGNLGIALSEEAVTEFKQAQHIPLPADYFLGKTIRVEGKIVLRDDRPYIDVKDADQLEEVKDPPQSG